MSVFSLLSDYTLVGKDVFKAGVATHYCDSSKLADLEGALIENPKNIDQVLAQFCPVVDHEFVLQKHMKQINECFSAPTIEGVLERLQKDDSEWAQQTIKVRLHHPLLFH